MRAYSDNEDLALLSGIDPKKIVLITWIIAGILATIGGALYGLDKSLWHYLFKGVRPKITINIGKSFGPYKLPRNKEARESELIKIGDDVMCRLAALLPNDAHGVYAKNPKIEIYKKENE